MSVQHLLTGRHYRVTVTSPGGELYAAHIMRDDNDRLRIAQFIKDEEAIDQINEVVFLLADAKQRDAEGRLQRGIDEVYLWDWEEVKWQLSTCLEPPPREEELAHPF